MPRLWDTAAEALAGVVKDGAIIAVGGFGLSGNPTDLIEALRDTGSQRTSRSSRTTWASTARGSACCWRTAR